MAGYALLAAAFFQEEYVKLAVKKPRAALNYHLAHEHRFDVERMAGRVFMDRLVQALIDDLHAAFPRQPGEAIFYPGERTLLTRKENMKLGIPVDEEIWQKVMDL